MKKIIIAFVTMLMLAGSYEAKSQINAGISFNTFYDELSPYGRWVNYPDYGQVWISNEHGFEPYSTNGHWDLTNYGWMWVSDYNWGWAPFHYGRWAFLNNYGWAWVPGYEWAPAWVGWCNYDGYYGWAPLSPGLGFNYSFGSIPVNYWRFVRPQYINDPYVYRHYQRPVQNVNQYNNVTVINNTVVNNNVTYVPGPAQQDIERVTNKKIEPKQVAFNANSTKKTVVLNNKKEITVFRPEEKVNTPAAQNTTQPKQQQVVKSPGVENDKQSQAPQTPVQQKQEIKTQKQPVQNETNADNDTRKKQVPQTQMPVIKKQLAQQDEIIVQQQNQEAIKQQESIRRQQQQEAVRQQEAIRQKQNEARQQEVIRKQQQNEARQQDMIRRQQEQKRQQNEIRQQKQIRQQRTQQPQMKQQQWNQPGIQKEPAQVPQRPVKPTRKG